MAKHRIRNATTRDIPTLVHHRRQMWIDMGVRGEKLLHEADVGFAKWVRREMKAKRYFAWLVEDENGAVVAGGGIWVLQIHPRPGYPNGGPQPYLLNFYTEPAHRGKRFASRLAKKCVEWSKLRGYPRVTLHASDQGMPIYERIGFVRTNEMKIELGPQSRGAGGIDHAVARRSWPSSRPSQSKRTPASSTSIRAARRRER